MAANQASGRFCRKVDPSFLFRCGFADWWFAASEYIKSLENNCKANSAAQGQLGQVVNDLDAVRRENESLRAENHRLFQEMNAYREARHNMVQAAPMPQHYVAAPAAMSVDPSRSLPPLTNGVHASSMQGVQYTDGVR